MDLVAPLPPAAWHQRNRHPPGIDLPAAREVDVAQANRLILVKQRLGHGDIDGGTEAEAVVHPFRAGQ
jgi:hypothetical protein